MQQPQTTVPSQRYAVQPQTPNCNRQQQAFNANVVVQQPDAAVAAARQQQLVQQRAVAQQAAVRNQQAAVRNQQQAVAVKQQQAAALNQQRSVLVQQRVAATQQAAPAQQATVLKRPVSMPPQQARVQSQPNGRVVMMTFRDPRTGQLFQRPYLVPNTQPAATQPGLAQQQPTSAVARSYVTPTAAASIPVTATPSTLAQTSFESPVLDPVEPQAAQEFSVFNQEEPTADATTGDSVLQDSLPKLDLEVDTMPTTSTEVKASTDLDLDFDLPPLNPQADE